jgi:hypothetical protein
MKQHNKIICLIVTGILLVNFALAQVGINTDGSSPDNSSMLDVKSDSKGILMPRMTLAQLNNIVSPANGLIAYCTDCNNSHGSLVVYFSGKWNIFSSDVINHVPQALAPSPSGIASVGNVLRGTYVYFDTEMDPEGASLYHWYRSDDALGTNETEIASTKNYTVTVNDGYTYLRFGVQPIAYSGSNPGFLTKSAGFFGPIMPNSAPTATQVAQSGPPATGQLLTGSYFYSDTENDPEQNSIYQWYRADDNSGSGEAAIGGATAITYATTSADLNKFIRFGVTPKSSKGVSPGIEGKAPFSAAINFNQPPTCYGLIIAGIAAQGSLLTGSYAYSDPEGNPMDYVLCQWYRADNSSGFNEVPIAGANSSFYWLGKTYYTLGSSDIGKCVRFGVVPFSVMVTKQGNEIRSSFTEMVSQNQPPVALNVNQTGGTHSGMTVNGGFSYWDPEGDPPGDPHYLWYVADDSLGTNEYRDNITVQSFSLQDFHIGKFIRAGVTPNAIIGSPQGAHVKASHYLGPVTPNLPPEATNVNAVAEYPFVGLWVNAGFYYTDEENDLQGGSIYTWYRADNASGLNEEQIIGASGSSYSISMADTTKFIRCGVVPVAITGTTTGTFVKADSFIGPVTKGISSCSTFTYSTVSAGGHVWMDRNLGASRVATSSFDFEASGSLFEWGRNSDGHQCLNRSSWTVVFPGYDTTSVKCTSGSCPNSLFVVSTTIPGNWVTTNDTTLWNRTSKGPNDPCPSGFRVPAQQELQDLWNSFTPQDFQGAFNSPAKIPFTGYRDPMSGNINSIGAMYWSSTSSATGSYFGSILLGTEISVTDQKTYGFAVRCIEE